MPLPKEPEVNVPLPPEVAAALKTLLDAFTQILTEVHMALNFGGLLGTILVVLLIILVWKHIQKAKKP